MKALYLVDEAKTTKIFKHLTLSPYELKDIHFQPCYGFMAKDNTIQCKVAQNSWQTFLKLLKCPKQSPITYKVNGDALCLLPW